jgi:hypothetical protein
MLNKFFIGWLLFLLTQHCLAQTGSQSPYSYFGIGEVHNQTASYQTGMGGLSFAVRDSFNVNFSNPASYASLRLTIFDVSVSGSYTQYQSQTHKASIQNGRLNYLTIAFPIKYKVWGSSIGLLPYTAKGYNMQTTGTINDSITYNNLYQGSGGLNKLYWGNGFAIAQNVAVGLNLSYIFGNISRDRSTEFTQTAYYNSSYQVSTQYGYVDAQAGLQFKTDSLFIKRKKNFIRYITTDSISGTDTIKIKKDLLSGKSYTERKRLKAEKFLRFNFGATGTLGQNVTETSDIYIRTYKRNNIGVVLQRDTILYEENAKAKRKLPGSFGLGFSLQEINTWLIGVDASYQNWSVYNGADNNLDDAYKVIIGGEWMPKHNSAKYLQRVAYRAGLKYEKTNLNLNNTAIHDYAISFGGGFPIRKDAVTTAYSAYHSKLNVGIEFGIKGTTKNKLLQENYVRLTLGINFADQWFIKRKFD